MAAALVSLAAFCPASPCRPLRARAAAGARLSPRQRLALAAFGHCGPEAGGRRRRGRGSPCADTWVVAAGGAGGLTKGGSSGDREEPVNTPGRVALLTIALLYFGIIIGLPTANVFYQAFSHGFGPFWESLTDPDFQHAAKLTIMLALVAVPINTVWGVGMALQISRNEFWGKQFVISLLDLPFSISPVITGLMLVLLYGREGWFAPLIQATGVRFVFAFPGMALATLFVTLPYVVRELIPVLDAMDLSEEEAARTLGASEWDVFWNVTFPNMRVALLYGVILTNARAMGEFGAVAVISGNIIGRTQTLTLYVESAYKEYNSEGAFSAAVLLSLLAFTTVAVKDALERLAEEEA